jgi:hypothetical protein
MNTKLTLRIDTRLIQLAKEEAKRQGKTVSQLVREFFLSLESAKRLAELGGTEKRLRPTPRRRQSR